MSFVGYSTALLDFSLLTLHKCGKSPLLFFKCTLQFSTALALNKYMESNLCATDDTSGSLALRDKGTRSQSERQIHMTLQYKT
jgi:hypothetical protein